MKKILSVLTILFALGTFTFAQKKKDDTEGSEKINVPSVVKTALAKKYPSAKKVTWEKEKGNYEANWGGKSGEDHSAQFSPSGAFIEMVDAISVSSLPKNIAQYVASNYKGSKINEAGKVTDASGTETFEVELKKKTLIFDLKGNFLRVEK